MNENIKKAQILAGEQAVINSLKEKGLIPKNESKHSEAAEKFFELFRQVRNEISTNDGYFLAEAIKISFDRWNAWNKDMPEFDGQYLALINQKQECGNVWNYQKVIHCSMNKWELDKGEEIVGWKLLTP